VPSALRIPAVLLTVALTTGAAVRETHAQEGSFVVPAAFPGHPPIFGTRELHSTNMTQFRKWLDVLARWKRDQATAVGRCSIHQWAECVPEEWAGLLEDLKGLPLRTMVERVNAAMNRHGYVPSSVNWGQSNYWETPFEFIRRDGQCQDYAVAKFMLLRQLGVPNELMRIVVVRHLPRQVDHAVVVVYVDGEPQVLDSLLPDVLPAAQVTHYRPYYSINETGWWLHLPNAIPPQRLAAQPQRLADAATVP
jgi:predicted transglutaminase-like cysteine proteinase